MPRYAGGYGIEHAHTRIRTRKHARHTNDSTIHNKRNGEVMHFMTVRNYNIFFPFPFSLTNEFTTTILESEDGMAPGRMGGYFSTFTCLRREATVSLWSSCLCFISAWHRSGGVSGIAKYGDRRTGFGLVGGRGCWIMCIWIRLHIFDGIYIYI